MSQHVAEIRHRVISVPGGRIHLAEQGTGPLVLLVHGFPESWYSWRHQLPALATAGYRAAAVDVRGYGRSSKPAATDAYRMLELVQDNVSAVHALGKETAVVISHDWGATIAANSALLRPGGLPRGGTAERSQHPMYAVGSQASTRLCPPTPCQHPALPTRTSSAGPGPCATGSPSGRLTVWLIEQDLDV
jgi:pimeloyl-ACP methyl ester carboxylesterase